MEGVQPKGLGEEARVFDLADRRIFRIGGEDRVRYLNGQVTQDVRRLRLGDGLPACVTNAKGKLQAVVCLAEAREGGGIWLEVETELAGALKERLERYVVADDVVIEDESDRWSLLHVLECSPVEMKGFSDLEAVRMERLGEVGWDVWMPQEERECRLGAWGGRFASVEEWEWLRVSRGIPVWGRELDEETLPPEAGLDRTHIDYHKGCYVGQEVISRLKSVGRVNRTLIRLRGGVLPEAGARLLGGDGEVGRVTSAVGMMGGVMGGVMALAYVKRGVELQEFEVEGAGRFSRV